MTPQRVRGALAAAGFEPAEAEARARTVGTAADASERANGCPPRWGWFVPGRIEIFGKHTDYAGGRSLLAAVPRGFAVVAAPRDDGVVHVTDAKWGETTSVDPRDEGARFEGWSNYVAVVARRLARDFPDATLGTDVVLASDLPGAAGLSSSSALVVGLAAALVRRARLDERPDWRAVIETPLDLAGYLGAVENGLRFKSLAGGAGVGTHGGSEDHTAILTCRAGHVSAYSYLPVRHQGDAPMPDAWRFVVAASGIRAAKAAGARERYNRASLATRALVELWTAAGLGAAETLADLLASRPDATGALRGRLADGGHGIFSGRELDQRLTHFIAEDERVPAAARAFRDADESALGALSAASQRDAEALLRNQTPETRELARLAREHGAFAASSFGAGFGGSVWALVEASRAATFAAAWVAAYHAAFPSVTNVESFVCWAGPGLVELT